MITADGRLSVRGRGVVTVIDASRVVTTAYTATGTQPLMMSDLRLHTLPRGAVFDLTARQLVSAPGLPAGEAGTVVSTLQHMPSGQLPSSRQIAAEGAHETTAELRRRPPTA